MFALARLDEAGLVCERDQLGAVVAVYFGGNAADMRLRGEGLSHKLVSNLGVAQTGRTQPQNFALANSECLELSRQPGCRVGSFRELANQPSGDGGRE